MRRRRWKVLEKNGEIDSTGKRWHDTENKGEAGSKTYRRLHNILLMWHPRCTLDLWRGEERGRGEGRGDNNRVKTWRRKKKEQEEGRAEKIKVIKEGGDGCRREVRKRWEEREDQKEDCCKWIKNWGRENIKKDNWKTEWQEGSENEKTKEEKREN